MRSRSQIVDSPEAAYRESLRAAEERGDARLAEQLQLDFVRDQVQLEALLDVRELLLPVSPADAGRDSVPDSGGVERVSGLLDTAQKLRNLTRLR